MQAVRPTRLVPGDTIGVVAPSNAVAAIREQMERGMGRLEMLGYRVVRGENLWQESDGMAGTVADRVADLHRMFADPTVKAVITATGGYGCLPLLECLDYDLIRRNPKILVGFSDVSILLNAIHMRTGLVTFHGTEIAYGFGLPGAHAGEEQHFLRVVTRAEPAGPLPEWAAPVRAVRPGKARGRLIGGNLPCFTHTFGTPYWPDLTGALLLVESIGINTPGFMRWLSQLRYAGELSKLSGIVIGHLERSFAERPDQQEALRWALKYGLGDLELPVWQTGCFGHMVPNVTFPLGCIASVDEVGLRIEEPAVS